MSEFKKILVRGMSGDISADGEQDVLDLFLRGRCKSGDFVYLFDTKSWMRACELPAVKNFFSMRPPAVPAERKVIYYQVAGHSPAVHGPFSLKEVQEKIRRQEIGLHTWVFVDGDKEWRQVDSVKVLRETLPPLPMEAPPEQESSTDLFAGSVPSIKFGDTNSQTTMIHPSSEHANKSEEREDITMAISALGLSADGNAAPALKKVPVPPSLPDRMILPAHSGLTTDFDGLTAEIPMEPIWLVKKADSETVLGPYRFLEVIKSLEQAKFTKNDKISKMGSKSFVKISQQFEFNVKYSLETVVVNGMERQKIFIRRRHPRVPYLADVQVTHKGATVAASCMNVSAGGILMESSKLEFALGDIIELKILPALIKQPIQCKALVIGKIPKMPPAYALKFQDLKFIDKEAIEFFVQETLKREQAKT